MSIDEGKLQGALQRSGRTKGFIPTSFRCLSRIVSSGASTVRSAASAIVDREIEATYDQVYWAGFDKLECEGDVTRQILLLGYRFGFQVWDVEEADNVRELVFTCDGHVSFMQMLPKPIASKQSGDKFADHRPLLVICADGSFSGCGYAQDGLGIPCNGNTQNCSDQLSGGAFVPTVVWFYSLKSQSYVHVLKFRSVVYSVRCSPRVVAVLQAAKIHCFDAATLEKEYTILTNPVVASCSGFGSIGLGPLAVGPRWIAYSGTHVEDSKSGRVSPQHLTPSSSFPGPTASNGSLVAHYAKESSKQIAAGIVTLGDMGYKKLSRYYSELLPDGNNSLQSASPGCKAQAIKNGHLPDADNVGMVVVRDVISKSVIAQFRAHKSPISSLCFDPSGTLLVTASVQGHSINVFRIMPALCGSSSGFDSGASYVQLYSLQRGFTNAVIQDISFSDDSQWIMISSSRGTSHLFAISPSGGSVNFQCADDCCTTNNSVSSGGIMNKPSVWGQQSAGLQMLNQQALCASAPPITQYAVSRIRSGNNGWRSTVTGAAAAAAGRSAPSGTIIASAFHNCKGKDLYVDSSSFKEKCHMLVFSPGCVTQYALRISSGLDSLTVVSAYELDPECDARLVVEAIRKWNICQRHIRREQREDKMDIYCENGNPDNSKIFPGGVKKENCAYPEARDTVTKMKIRPEEKHHMYISEAELQMHEPRILLWAKPKIYFQSLMEDDIKIDMADGLEGEIEIERFPTYLIEARSRNLVPVLCYLQTSKIQQARVPALDNGQLLHQRTSGLSEKCRHMCRSSCGSLDSMTDGGVAVVQLQHGIEEMPKGNIEGHVNNDIPKLNTPLEIVNNRERSAKEGDPIEVCK